MKRFFRVAILIALIFTAKGAFAANWYVHKGATGANNGTSWTNAWNEMSAIGWSSVACGDTVWLAGGSYTSALDIGVSKNCSAGTVLNVNRVLATDAVPVASPGWSAAFDSQVILPNINVEGPAAYITINGREWQGGVLGSGGIEVLIPGSSGDGIDAGVHNFVAQAIDHITWTYVEIYGPACVNSGNCSGGGVVGIQIMPFCSGAIWTNLLFDHMAVHRTGEALRGCGQNGTILQYSLIYNMANDGQQHEDILYSNPPYTNVTWRYNQIFLSPNDGIFFEGSTGGQNWSFYGNMIYHSGASLITCKSGSSCGPWHIYNNVFENDGTFGDFQPAWIAFNGSVTGEMENNVFENVQVQGSVPTMDYNAYSTTVGKQDSGTHSFTYNAGTLGASSLFISESPSNPIAANFRLTSSGATTLQNGIALAAPYNVDPDGNTRGSNGHWYIGAYTFGSSSAPKPPTGLTITVQ